MPIRRIGREWLDQFEFERKLRRATPVLVYQMGKVGSESIYRSLAKEYAGPVLHAHHFTSNHGDPLVRRLYDWAIVQARPLKVISLTREPISRNVSAFFQNFEKHTGFSYAEANFSIEELKAIFLSNCEHEIPLEWFDNHILAEFGIDVFSTPFPENGICTYRRNNVELLVMRLEISDNVKITAIKNFVGLDCFLLHNSNIGDEKNYSATYKAFKTKVKFSACYVDTMCASKYFRHFYSQEAITIAREIWSEG